MRGRSTHDVGSASPRTRASSGRSPRARGVPDRTFRACAAPVLSSWAQRATRSRKISSGVSQCAVRPALPPGLRSRHAGGCPGAGRARHGRVLDDGDAGGLRAGARAAGAVRQRARGAGPAPVVDRRWSLGPAGRGAFREVGEGRALHRGSRPRLRPRSHRDARCAGRGVRARGAGVRRRRQGAVDPRREGCGRGARRAGARGRAGRKRLHLPLVLGHVR